MKAALPLGSTKLRDPFPRTWRYNIQIQYQRANTAVNECLKTAIQERADLHNAYLDIAGKNVGFQVWLYLDRVKEGYARKMAHMWHGPFRVAEMCGECAVRLEIAGTPYRLFQVVHISKLKKVKTYPDRPTNALRVTEADQVLFDEAILPEDTWTNDLEDNDTKWRRSPM